MNINKTGIINGVGVSTSEATRLVSSMTDKQFHLCLSHGHRLGEKYFVTTSVRSSMDVVKVELWEHVK